MNKKLYRSSKDKMLGGVAAGLAEYFDIDPTIVRILFVISLFLGGAGVLAYIIMWIIVPEQPFTGYNQPQQETSDAGAESPIEKNFSPANDPKYYERLREKKEKRMIYGGVILIFLGFILLADNFIPRIHFHDFFPLILLGIGIALLINSKKNKNA